MTATLTPHCLHPALWPASRELRRPVHHRRARAAHRQGRGDADGDDTEPLYLDAIDYGQADRLFRADTVEKLRDVVLEILGL